jgi:hypothetical protein
MWFDRYGARHTVASLSLLAVAGALWIAAPGDAVDLIGRSRDSATALPA